MHLPGICCLDRSSSKNASALDCRTVRHRRLAPQTQVARGFFPGPSPDGLVSVEVWAVPWQIQQLQSQPWRPQVFPHRLPAVGWCIVPDHLQEPRISGLCMTTFCTLLTFLWWTPAQSAALVITPGAGGRLGDAPGPSPRHPGRRLGPASLPLFCICRSSSKMVVHPLGGHHGPGLSEVRCYGNYSSWTVCGETRVS